MKNITITIPDNCELVKEGNTYVIKEKGTKPKSWEEFCRNNSIQSEEVFISSMSDILSCASTPWVRDPFNDRNMLPSKEEAEAFLALMQLRQLRKAWVGDWEQPNSHTSIGVILCSIDTGVLFVDVDAYDSNVVLSFPSGEMAKEFLKCFKDLCETAKILL